MEQTFLTHLRCVVFLTLIFTFRILYAPSPLMHDFMFQNEERKNEQEKECLCVFFYLPWWVRLARVAEWASVSRPGHFTDRSWDLASALLCQGDFKSESPEPWESRERSWAVCSACGVENKPLAGKHGQTHSQPHPQLCRAAVSSD